MGSILAFLSRESPPDLAVVERMAGAAPHRGDRSRQASIGRAVVAATFRSEREDAWIHGEQDLVVGYSGALDNASELWKEWTGKDAGTGPVTPADVVTAGIRALGVEAVARRMRGVFAVVVTDGQSLWAFRDHLGLHPVAYREDSRGLFVAPEAKQIVAGSGIRYEPDLEVLEKILYEGLVDDARCPTAGVLYLGAARVLHYSEGRTELHRYWKPESLLETSKLEPGEIRERFHGLMEQAVGRCLNGGDVVSLSGGVDSPAVAAFAAPIYFERTGTALPALSVVYPNHPSVDETRYIRPVADELGMPLHTLELSTRPTDDLDRWVRLLDGPVPVMAFGQVFEFLDAARELGFRNVLTGELEEFLFEMHTAVLPYLVARGRIVPALRYAQARRVGGDSIGNLVKKAGVPILPRWIRSTLYARRKVDPAGAVPPWVDGRRMRGYESTLGPHAWRDDQLVVFEGSGLSLGASNTIHAMTGTWERLPFADVDLCEFALALPARVKHADPRPKGLLRGLLRGKVPDLVLDRRDKTVFDSHVTANIDYRTLRRWLVEPVGPPIAGVRYDLLAERLRQESITLREYIWAKDLASVHAFLSLWENGHGPGKS